MTDPGSEVQPAPAPQCPSCGVALEPSAQICPACGRPVAYQPPDVDLGGWITAGWNLFTRNPAAAILIPLVMIVPAAAFGGVAGFLIGGLSAAAAMRGENWVSLIAAAAAGFGLLALITALIVPALTAGVYACFLAGIRTGKLTAEHLGDGFRNWWSCTWVMFALTLATYVCVPFMLVLVGIPAAIGVMSLMWLAVLHIVDRQEGGEASLNFAWRAMQGRLWMMLLFTLVVYILTWAGSIAFYIGLLVTTPIGIGAFAAGYDALSKRMPAE